MNNTDFVWSFGVTTTIAQTVIQLRQTMRTTPGVLEGSNIGLYRVATGASVTGGTLTLHQGAPDQAVLRYTVGSATFAAGETQLIGGTGSGSYIAFSAEL
jgi:hypothetical protein